MTRTLIVLADGLQAAFAAGAVAELARRGWRWQRGFGAGLGAQVAALGLIGEAAECERRWRREADRGCPLLQPSIAAARRASDPGMLVLPDPWRFGGWLDGRALAEHLAPEAGGLPDRLAGNQATLSLAVEDLTTGERSWRGLGSMAADEAARALAATARFPGGWAPLEHGGELLWGGVGAAPDLPPLDGDCDLVCGFPVPPVVRPGLAPTLVDAIQRRCEAVQGGRVAGSAARVVAPTAALWRELADRADADLGVEYPLPLERNGELATLLLALGARAASP